MKKSFLTFFVMGTILTITSCEKEKIVVEEKKVLAEIESTTLSVSADGSIFSGTYGDNPSSGVTTEADYACGACPLVRVGTSSNQNWTGRTLIKFDLSTLPEGATITGANLVFNGARVGQSMQPVMVHKLLEDWTEGTIDDACTSYCSEPGELITTGGETDATWKYTNHETKTEWTTPGGHFEAVASAQSTDDISSINSFGGEGLVEDLQAWQADATSNFGWLVKSTEVDDDNGQLARFHSSESDGQEPKLIVFYTTELE